MPLAVTTGTFTALAGTGLQAITGLGFAPKALLFMITDQTATGVVGHARFGQGLTDGSTDGAVAVAWEDQGASTTTQRATNSHCLTLISQTGTILAEATCSSLDADGFTLNWTTAGGSRLVSYLALGGDGILDAQTGWHTITSGGTTGRTRTITTTFAPDAVLTCGTATGRPGGLWLGAATRSPAGQQVSAQRLRSGSGNRGSTGLTTAATLAEADDDTQPKLWAVDLWFATGVRFVLESNESVGASFAWLALRGSVVDLIDTAQPAVTGVQSIALPRTPKAVLIHGPDRDVVDTWAVNGPATFVRGWTDGTDQGAIWCGGTDGTPHHADTDRTTTTAIQSRTAGTTALQASATAALATNALDLDWMTVDATPRHFGIISFADTATTDRTGNANLTQADQTLQATGRVRVTGQAVLVQDNQTLAATGQVAVRGTTDLAQADHTVIATGQVRIRGDAVLAQADQTVQALQSGAVGVPQITWTARQPAILWTAQRSQITFTNQPA